MNQDHMTIRGRFQNCNHDILDNYNIMADKRPTEYVDKNNNILHE